MVVRMRSRPSSASNGASVANTECSLEERVPAAGGCDRAVERGVGVDHAVVVHGRALEARLLGLRVLVGGAEEDLVEAELDLAGIERDHAAVVVRDDLEAGSSS